LSAIDISVV